MRRPARLRYARRLPGGFGTPPSATMSGREKLVDGEVHLASSRAGPEPKIPQWSAERRASYVTGREAFRKTPVGLRYWPAQGCRCTRAPVGAPLPHLARWGHWQTSEDILPRENDAVCVFPPLCARAMLARQ